MAYFEIVAHRGISNEAPENTLPAFQRAIELGADAVEFDVRLSADRVPMVFHYYYLDRVTSGIGPIFNYTIEQLREVEVYCQANPGQKSARISTLSEVLDFLGGRIGMEIEIKGPEPEAPQIIADIIWQYKTHWDRVEVTSYQPAILLEIQRLCPGLEVNLLFPRSESWMKLDVAAYQALHHSRMAQVKAVHMHPSQLSAEVVSTLRDGNIEIHAWDVNDEEALKLIDRLSIPRIDTDNFELAKRYRDSKYRENG